MGIFFSIDQFDVSEIQVLLIIDVNVRKFIHQVNYSQINQLCSIIELCLWTVFHRMPFITHSFCCHSNALQPLSKFHALHREQHTQKKVGLRDRGRCRMNPLCPSHLVCTLPNNCCWFQPSFLAAMQSRVQGISQDSPLDGSTLRRALIDTWPSCNKTTGFPSDLEARVESTFPNSHNKETYLEKY